MAFSLLHGGLAEVQSKFKLENFFFSFCLFLLTAESAAHKNQLSVTLRDTSVSL